MKLVSWTNMSLYRLSFLVLLIPSLSEMVIISTTWRTDMHLVGSQKAVDPSLENLKPYSSHREKKYEIPCVWENLFKDKALILLKLTLGVNFWIL